MMGHTLVVVFNVTCPGVVSEARARRAPGGTAATGATSSAKAQLAEVERRCSRCCGSRTIASAAWRVLFRSNSDVQWCREHGRTVAAGPLADDAVEHADDVFSLPVGELGDEHAGDRIAADGPVP
jgi:hypothetical protein